MNRLEAYLQNYPLGTMEKQAFGKQIVNYGKHLVGDQLLGAGGFGGMGRWAAKKFGAKGTYDQATGAFKGSTTWDPVKRVYKNTSGQPLTWQDKMWARTNHMTEVGAGMQKGWADNLQNIQKRYGTAASKAVEWGAPAAAIGGVIANEAYLGDSVLGLPGKAVNMAFDYASPLGIGLNLVQGGMKWVGDKVQNTAIDAAEQGARMTAQQMAQEQANAGRMAHLFGAWDPQAYAQEANARAQQTISQRFAEMRGGLQQ